MRVHIFQALALTICAWSVASCAAIEANVAISDGINAVQEAERYEASKYARYSYAKAELMLNAAKVRNGYGDYAIAQKWAKEAQTLAGQAKQKAKSRKNLEDQKNRVKSATKKRPEKRLPKASKSPASGNQATTPPRKRMKLLPPPRTKRKLLPPKRGSGDSP
jgi:hypothetical protein